MPKISKETERKILIALSSILAVFLIFSASFFLVLIDKGFYDRSYTAYGAYQKVGVDGVRSTTDGIISYMLGNEGDTSKFPRFYVFTENEQLHLQDVHRTIKLIKYFSIISAILLLVGLLRMRANGTVKEDSGRVLKYSAISTAAIIAAAFLIIFGIASFQKAFISFHKVLFPQGNWSFPPDALLIILFPQQFFEDFTKRVFLHALVISTILFMAGKALDYMNPEKSEALHQKHRHPKKKNV